MHLKIRIYDIRWNDKKYKNDWFEIFGEYESANQIDIETILELHEEDCNEDEDRDDLVITHYELKIENE